MNFEEEADGIKCQKGYYYSLIPTNTNGAASHKKGHTKENKKQKKNDCLLILDHRAHGIYR